MDQYRHNSEAADKEMQDTSCPGVWGCAPASKSPPRLGD